MDDYPFPYYLVLEDMNSLSEILGNAFRQWFEILAQIQSPNNIKQKKYAIGGHYGGDGWLSFVEVFDTITQECPSIPKMTTKRFGYAVVSIGDKIYVFGGCDGHTYFSSAEVDGVTIQEWTQLPDMKRKGIRLQLLQLGILYTFLGDMINPPFIHPMKCLIILQILGHLLYLIKDRRFSCQAVTVDHKNYVMGGSTITSSVGMFEIHSLMKNKQKM